MVALIKPQFEVPKWQENFFGVIEDGNLLKNTLENVYQTLVSDNIGIYDATISPIRGHKGNREFLALLMDGKAPDPVVKTPALTCEAFLEACLGACPEIQ